MCFIVVNLYITSAINTVTLHYIILYALHALYVNQPEWHCWRLQNLKEFLLQNETSKAN